MHCKGGATISGSYSAAGMVLPKFKYTLGWHGSAYVLQVRIHISMFLPGNVTTVLVNTQSIIYNTRLIRVR